MPNERRDAAWEHWIGGLDAHCEETSQQTARRRDAFNGGYLLGYIAAEADCARNERSLSDDDLRAIGDVVAAELKRPKCDELRAILAPLLDDPLDYIGSMQDDGGYQCRICSRKSIDRGHVRHSPDCPVLRRDEILGFPGQHHDRGSDRQPEE